MKNPEQLKDSKELGCSKNTAKLSPKKLLNASNEKANKTPRKTRLKTEKNEETPLANMSMKSKRERKETPKLKEYRSALTKTRKPSESMGRVFGMLLIAGILVMMFKGMGAMTKNVRSQIGGANPFSRMGKADFTLIDPLIRKGKGTKFSDVAGLKEPKVEVLEFVDCLKNP